MNIFQRIGRALSRLSRSPGSVPAGGVTGRLVDMQQIEAVEEHEFPPEEEQDRESE